MRKGLLFVLSFGLIFAQANVQLSITNLVGGTSGSANVAMTATSGNSPAALEFAITYPAGVSNVVVALGPIFASGSKTLNCGPPSASQVECLIYGTTAATAPTTISNGTIATLSFNGPSALTLGMSSVYAASPTGTAITAAGTGSGVFSKYDLNQDGVVNSLDVNIALSQSLGQTACSNGDVNKDGSCNVVDVMLVVLASFGLIPL